MAPPLIQGFSEAERAAIFAAIDRAAIGNPSLVRHAILAAPVTPAVSDQRSALSQTLSSRSGRGIVPANLQSPISDLQIRPVVLSDMLALEELEHSAIVGGPHSPLDDAHLIYILAHGPCAVRAALAIGRREFSQLAADYLDQFTADIGFQLTEISRLQLRLARSTAIAKAAAAGDSFNQLPGKASGCGWAFTLADVLAHEYGWDHAEIWDEIPLVILFTYFSTIKERLGVKSAGPSYAEQDLIAARATASQSPISNFQSAIAAHAR